MTKSTSCETVLRTLAATAVAVLLLGALPAAAQSVGAYDDPGAGDDPAGYDAGYSYVRNLVGDATLVQGDDGARDDLQINQPVLAGDRLWVAPGSRVEMLLSDGNLLRLDGDSELVLTRLAGSPETGDTLTDLVLLEGHLQLVVFADALGDELPRVELPNGTVYVQQAGSYRITAAGGDWSQVVARDGWAEVDTGRGSVVVRGGEEAILDGDRAPRSVVRTASALDDLERWGDRLDRAVDDSGHVDRSLRYAAAPLDQHGDWISVDDRAAWRPRVEAGWSPYWNGRWEHTPIGLTWVSYEPWGWVPYHYGTWDYQPAYGWVWYPGTAFSPAWVYWYWGPSQVAWVPVGYYTHYYHPRYRQSAGFRFGVYGWAGGDWGIFGDWTFCDVGYFGTRFQSRHVWRGRSWERHHGGRALPRGIITTDTRPLGRDDWRDPERALRALRTRPGARVAAGGRDLPDVTAFVARRGALPRDVEQRVLVTDRTRGARLSGTPLRPTDATVARPRATVRRGASPAVRSARGTPGGPDDSGVRVVPRGSVRTDRPAAGGRGAAPSERPVASTRGVIRARPDATAPRGTVSPRVSARPGSGVRTAPSAPSASERMRDPERGQAARPRTVTPRPSARPGSGVRTSPSNPSASQRMRDPQRGQAARPRTVTPRPSARGSSGAAAPRAVPRGDTTPSSRGGSGRPGAVSREYSVSPRFRASGATAGARQPAAPRRVTVPPRTERGARSAAPPARRVVGGIRRDPQRSGSSAPPARPPAATPRRSPSAGSSAAPQRGGSRPPAAGSPNRGGRRPAASSRSSVRPRGGRGAAPAASPRGGRTAPRAAAPSRTPARAPRARSSAGVRSGRSSGAAARRSAPARRGAARPSRSTASSRGRSERGSAHRRPPRHGKDGG